jgi:NAD(P)-dependent dehydrogenase (short-subunit alcohol dehydrogenase family)
VDLELKDKVVLVTGGAKEIGVAIVPTVAAEGAIPVIVDRAVEAGNRLPSCFQQFSRSAPWAANNHYCEGVKPAPRGFIPPEGAK